MKPLSEKIVKNKEININDEKISKRDLDFIFTKDVREFIHSIQSKVLTDWKGQNEFIDWLEKEVGDDLK